MVIPVHNRAATIERALRSVLTQRVPVDEVIVVDDGSTDDTPRVLAAVAATDGRVRVVRQANLGAPVARNTGIALASGDLIAFQDSDDEWLPGWTDALLPLAGSMVMVFGSHEVLHRDGTREIVPPTRVAHPARALLRRNVASTQTVLLDAELLRTVRFDPGLQRFQDWDLWLSLLETSAVRMVHVPTTVAVLHRMDDSISAGLGSIRDRSLRRILVRHRNILLRDPIALGRLVARSMIRPVFERARSSFVETRSSQRPTSRRMDTP
ncbi:glycosyltransferase family 2 protein [Isoptericola sp. NPDC058082]|uniref:glycosyltransferase family 2 protein n=1 Tax=Isoptericola sp. NPDC058082 TaxID=3346331 RepID=UPI0036EE9C97